MYAARCCMATGRHVPKRSASAVCDHAGFRHEASILPFELHVLEVAIGDVCQLCSGLVKELESSGHPILDTLVKHVRPTSSPPRTCQPCALSAHACL